VPIALPEHEARARHEAVKQEMIVKQLRMNAALNCLGHLAKSDFEGAILEDGMIEKGALGGEYKRKGIRPDLVADAAIAYGDELLMRLGVLSPKENDPNAVPSILH
jgi:hypothetical protein